MSVLCKEHPFPILFLLFSSLVRHSLHSFWSHDRFQRPETFLGFRTGRIPNVFRNFGSQVSVFTYWKLLLSGSEFSSLDKSYLPEVNSRPSTSWLATLLDVDSLRKSRSLWSTNSNGRYKSIFSPQPTTVYCFSQLCSALYVRYAVHLNRSTQKHGHQSLRGE